MLIKEKKRIYKGAKKEQREMKEDEGDKTRE